MKRQVYRSYAAALLLAAGCSRAPGATPASAPSASPPSASTKGTSEVEAKLGAVARIHGGAGPWAVAGYRMGEFAIGTLGLERGSFDLEVVHYTPHEVQYSCIADGAAAATGASLGKLNLALADASAPETRTTYLRKSSGKSITLRVTKAFATRFANVPREQLGDAGREAMQLGDDQIFEAAP